MKEITDTFVSAFENYPIISGFLLIGIGLCLLIFRLEKKNTFKMQDYNVIEWRLLVQTWGLIAMIILSGVILIIKNIL